MENISIIRPAAEYLDDFRALCVECWNDIHDRYLLRDPDAFSDWKETLFDDYLKAERGEGLPNDLVPSVFFWAFASSRLVGVVNIRPKLNERLKKYGGHIGIVVRPTERNKGFATRFLPICIERAKELGAQKVLLTCVEKNASSLRSLESFPNVGREKDDAVVDGRRTKIQRFYF